MRQTVDPQTWLVVDDAGHIVGAFDAHDEAVKTAHYYRHSMVQRVPNYVATRRFVWGVTRGTAPHRRIYGYCGGDNKAATLLARKSDAELVLFFEEAAHV